MVAFWPENSHQRKEARNNMQKEKNKGCISLLSNGGNQFFHVRLVKNQKNNGMTRVEKTFSISDILH